MLMMMMMPVIMPMVMMVVRMPMIMTVFMRMAMLMIMAMPVVMTVIMRVPMAMMLMAVGGAFGLRLIFSGFGPLPIAGRPGFAGCFMNSRERYIAGPGQFCTSIMFR